MLFSMSLGYTGAWITRLAVPSAVHLAIIKTNSQSNKAAPFCKRKLYFTSLGTGKIAKCEARSLDDFSTFSALDYNLISFGIKRQTILVNNVLPLARVRSSYLAKDLLVCQTTCPPSQKKPKHWIWFQSSTRGEEPQDVCDFLTWACRRAGSFMTSVSIGFPEASLPWGPTWDWTLCLSPVPRLGTFVSYVLKYYVLLEMIFLSLMFLRVIWSWKPTVSVIS